MKAPRIPATIPELAQTMLGGNTTTQNRKILSTEIPPGRLLKEAKTEPPNKLLKIQGRHKRDVKNEGVSQ